jgi:uncharacterized protein DUF5615
MKFKLDETLGSRTAGLIEESGHDVETVAQEKLRGTSDARLLEICIAERRCLISLTSPTCFDFRRTIRPA